MGIFTAASIVFFAFIGFDVVATAAEETRVPQRDMPRGILASLVICTLLYVAVSIVVTGMQNYSELSVSAPLADAFKAVGHPFYAGVISFGAAVGLTTVCMILLLGQTRVFFAMSRDGLLPRFFSVTHPRFGTPYRPTILLGVVIAVVAGFTSINELATLVNIGTLFAFVVVALGVIVLRRTRPDLHRAFRTPWVPLLPIVSVAASVWLMLNLPHGDLAPVRDLDGARRDHLLRVRAKEQPYGEGLPDVVRPRPRRRQRPNRTRARAPGPVRLDPLPQPTVGRDDDTGPYAVGGGGQLGDQIVPAAGRRLHAHPRHGGDPTRGALHDQHQLDGPGLPGQPLGGVRDQRVPQPLGGAPPVPPPAVRHRPHHIGGVDDHEGPLIRHPRRMSGQPPVAGDFFADSGIVPSLRIAFQRSPACGSAATTRFGSCLS